jgi:hypothetical protein
LAEKFKGIKGALSGASADLANIDADMVLGRINFGALIDAGVVVETSSGKGYRQGRRTPRRRK